jgi:hypothetical protein
LERLKSLGSILILILVLIVLALVAVIWPMIMESLDLGGMGVGSFLGGPTRPSTEQVPIVFPIPEPIASVVGMNELVLQGFVAFAALAAIVIGSVVVFGLIITLLMRLGGRFTTEVAESEDYQEHVAALETKEKETLKTRRESAPEPSKPEAHGYGLDPLSFSLLVLFFVAMLAALIYGLVSPTGEIILFGQTFNSMLPILLILFVITIPLLAWQARRNRLDAIAENDNASIPWDFIAVLITGLLVVGVGLGIMLYINNPM